MAAPMRKHHHERLELCTTRAKYREGRELKAVKVYTISKESKYLLVQGIPAVGAKDDLLKMFALYGAIDEYRILDEYPAEEFTEVIWIKFQRIQAARVAKRKMDDESFYGGVLHVCYAPEFESVQDTREKLQDRRKAVAARIRKLDMEAAQSSNPLEESTPTTSTLAVSEEWAYHKPSAGGSSSRPRDPLLSATTGAPPTIEQGTYNDIAPHPMTEHPREPYMYPPLPLPPRHTPPWQQNYPPQHIESYYPQQGRSHSNLHTRSVPFSSTEENSPRQGSHEAKLADNLLNSEPGKDIPNTTDKKLSIQQNIQSQQTVDGLVVKVHKPASKVPPKFVPRQVSQVRKPFRLKHLLKSAPGNLAVGSPPQQKGGKEDEVNAALKREAFVLRDVAGPVLPSDKGDKATSPDSTETGNESVDQTVIEIRKRVREFSTIAPPPQLRRKKKR